VLSATVGADNSVTPNASATTEATNLFMNQSLSIGSDPAATVVPLGGALENPKEQRAGANVRPVNLDEAGSSSAPRDRLWARLGAHQGQHALGAAADTRAAAEAADRIDAH
jgi:hypothetical protein